ncbi:MAG: PD40 domain-containing protein, partial [Bacteroidia bacterium]|nr:PD40 domain-containing protein [Bacteroidia bacterium]
MKITIRILTILMLSGFSLACLGQDEYGGLAKKDYHKLVDDADNYFATEDYREALPLFLKLSKIDPHNTDFLFGIGACYLESAEEKIKAIEYFEECTKDPEVDDEIYYYLGRSYHTNYKFDEAISAFSRFLLSAQENHPYKADAHHYIEMCGYARKLIKDSLHVKIINLGPTVNTPFPEYSPVITADESKLIFTSRREGSTGGMIKEIRDYAEDIYISHKENNVWSQATGIGRSINSVFSDASVGLSADGQKLLVYKDSEDDGNIYISQLIGETYTKPIKMGSNINTKAHEFSASLTPDGNTVYFSSDRKGGYGGKDIYRVQKLSGGDWGFAMNLGDNVNSKYDEDAPFIHPDSKHLYFSSKGHNSMGGYDIFVSNIGNSNYISKPNNIGYPINTTDDDIFFVLSASAKRAYYASAKKGGYGSTDIYMIEMEGDKKIGSIASSSGGQFEEETQAAIVMMRGRVLDEVNKLPVGAFIRLTDLQTSELVGVWNANKADGKFLVILNPGENYGIHVEAEGYLFHSEN